MYDIRSLHRVYSNKHALGQRFYVLCCGLVTQISPISSWLLHYHRNDVPVVHPWRLWVTKWHEQPGIDAISKALPIFYGVHCISSQDHIELKQIIITTLNSMYDPTSAMSLLKKKSAVKSLIQDAPNPKTWMFLVSSCSCLCPIYWSQVLNREWRWSWAVPTGNVPTTFEWSIV